jgi:hypothetical protein
MDEFFQDSDKAALSGCDATTWTVIHLAVRAAIQEQELPPSSIDNDSAWNNQIQQCLNTVKDKSRSNQVEFYKSLQNPEVADIFKTTVPGAEAAKALAENIFKKQREYRELLYKGGVLQDIIGFAELASRKYLDHAEQARYRNLVERYNALANSLANVRLAQGSSFPIQPRALHCESSMNSLIT